MEVKAKKSLGQNFLQDEQIIEEILRVAEIGPEDSVFEIGPGTGALTKRLAERAKRVVAIELDHQLVIRLQEHFERSEGVSILEGNILDINLNEMLEQSDFAAHQYKVVANIPYYITAPIIRTLLSLKFQPKSLTLMVQKEVAERLTAEPGAISLISLMAQYYSNARVAFLVSREAFDPMPEVESAVVHLVPRRAFDPEVDRKVFRIARSGFAARRKTLTNNLSSSLGVERSVVEKALAERGLRLDIRAQALSVADWEYLAEKLSFEKSSTP